MPGKKSIQYILLKQQSIKIITAKYHRECNKFWKLITFTKTLLDEINYSFKIVLSKEALSVESEGPLSTHNYSNLTDVCQLWAHVHTPV